MNARDVFQQAIAQGKALDELIEKANGAQAVLREAKDRVFYSIQDAFSFQQGQNVAQNLVFNVPQSEDFEAVRLSLYPFVRRVSVETLPAATTNDLVFRPTTWVFQYPSQSVARYGVDALVELTSALSGGSTRAYQNAAFFVAQTFSGFTSPIAAEGFGVQTFDSFQSPSALVFEPFWHLPKGSTVTARVTPSFSGERSADFNDGLVNEYQIRGVLEGFKRTR